MRLIVISSHYRSPLTFNSDVIEANGPPWSVCSQPNAQRCHEGASQSVLDELEAQIQTTRQGFNEAMDEDFNTAGALGTIFDLVRMINQARSEGATDEELAPAQETFNELTGVLGLELAEKEKGTTEADAFIELLLDLRQELRAQKNYALSDRIRDDLVNLGVVIEDTPQGSSWHWE